MIRFAHCLQNDAMDCGPACLCIIAKHYGRRVSLERLRMSCFKGRQGVSLIQMSSAAEQVGLHSIGVIITWEQLCHAAPFPCIVHWNQNHFVVLYKQKRGKKFYIADPGKGLTTYNRKEFVEHWVSTRSQGEEKGIAMFIQPTPDFYEQEGE